jgi:phage virion morphogenesis protein
VAASDDNALAALEEWLGQVMTGLSPAKRKRVLMKVGQSLRRSNLARIQANVEPDGSAMVQRKSRLDRRGKVRSGTGGKMFRKLRFARRWAIKATPNSVELMPKSNSLIPAIHHFGRKGFVGRGPDGRKIFTRYPERRLLGFAREDEEQIIDIVSTMVDP